MDIVQSHQAEMISIAVAVVAIGAGTAYYFYVTRKPKGCLDPENFEEFKLVKLTQLNHNVAKFRFALPTATSVFGLPIGQHMSCRDKDSLVEEVVKPYTPTTLDSDTGYFELVIKGCFKYQSNQVRAFGMIAGGTGITPVFQVTKAILENPNDKTNIHLIYANATYEDILLKEEVDNFAISFSNRFGVCYFLNQPPEGWDGGIGFVTKEMIQTHCPPPGPDVQMLQCGLPPMNKAMAGHVDALGYTSQMLLQF